MPLTPSLKRLALISLLLLAPAALAQKPGGLQPGAPAPAFSLPDQNGHPQDLHSLSGPRGLLLLFFRSADWCPFCKGQLVDLQAAQQLFRDKGINVAAISNDSPGILADFAHRRSITYPLLSDHGSATIDSFGIRNPEGEGIEAGIPFPGYFLIAPDSRIQRRYFETAYVNRLTAHHLYSNLFGNAALPAPAQPARSTPQVAVTTAQSDTEITPGADVQLLVHLTPAADTHLYAPGAEKQNYHVTSLQFKRSELYATSPVAYPKSELLNFPQLNETVPVYNGETVLTASAVPIVDGKTIPNFSRSSKVTIAAELEYQACTSTTCYPPVKVPVEWALTLRPLDRDRAPKDLQHR